MCFISDDHSVPLDVCPLLSRGAFSPVECCRTEDVCNVVEWGRPCPACLQTSPGLPLLFPLASASGQVAAYSYRGDVYYNGWCSVTTVLSLLINTHT